MLLYVYGIHTSMSEDRSRVDFNAPTRLVEEADAVADLLNTSRTALLVEGLQRRLAEIVSEESFQRRVREAYYDGEIDGETLAALLGREEAHRVGLLRESLARESRLPTAEDVSIPDAEALYEGELPTWHPDDGGADPSEEERSAGDG